MAAERFLFVWAGGALLGWVAATSWILSCGQIHLRALMLCIWGGRGGAVSVALGWLIAASHKSCLAQRLIVDPPGPEKFDPARLSAGPGPVCQNLAGERGWLGKSAFSAFSLRRADVAEDRGNRLSSRLPIDLRAGSRTARRSHHRVHGARQRLHGGCDLRESCALRRTRASRRPAAASDAPYRCQRFGEFAPISWDDAPDLVAENFLKAEQRHGRGRLALLLRRHSWAW